MRNTKDARSYPSLQYKKGNESRTYLEYLSVSLLRIIRDRALFKVHYEFVDAATKGAMYVSAFAFHFS